jgi:N-methylhydantoinase B
MLSEYHFDGLDDLADEIIARSEKSIRSAIERVPDGIYRAEGVIEQMEGQADIVIKAAVEINGSDISVDLAGSSPQVTWGGNVVYNFTFAYVHMAIKSIFDPDLPNNHGSVAVINLNAPRGSVVNCRFPAAVAARMQIGHFMTEIIYRALAQALPDRVIAGSGGTPATMNVFTHATTANPGIRHHSRRGMGASNRRWRTVISSRQTRTPVEISRAIPLIVERHRLWTRRGGEIRWLGRQLSSACQTMNLRLTP